MIQDNVQQIFDEYAVRMRKSSCILACSMLVTGLSIGFQMGILVAMLIRMWR